MNIAKSSCFFVIALLLILSCKSDNKDSYAISDFSDKLRPYLIEEVSKGVVGYDYATNYIREHATDEELKHLSKSEHPVLRAMAFREMLERKTFNHFDIIMNNLDDSAIVATDQGEFGIIYMKLADDILENGRWKDTIAKNKTIEQVILKHNHLRSAFLRVSDVQPKEIYYPSIREMAVRERPYEGLGGFGFSGESPLQYREQPYSCAGLAAQHQNLNISSRSPATASPAQDCRECKCMWRRLA